MNSRIHFTYVICILTSIVIILLTVKFSVDDKLVNYVAFALTLTSLIVGIFSIIYSFMSNNSLTDSLANIKEAAKNVNDTSFSLTEQAIELNKRLLLLPQQFSDFSAEIKDSLFKAQTDRKPTEKQADINDALIISAIKTSAMGYRIFLYALVVSKQKNKSFSIKKIFGELGYKSAIGFGAAFSCLGIINWNLIDLDIAICTKMHPAITEKIKELCDMKAHPDDEAKRLLQKMIDEIEAM